MIKMINGVMRTWSWWKGFVAGVVTFTAAAMIILLTNDDYIIRDTSKGQKKMVI